MKYNSPKEIKKKQLKIFKKVTSVFNFLLDATST